MNRLVLLFIGVALSACGQSAPQRGPLADARIGGPFALTGEEGRVVRDTDFAGSYRLVYFGYTYCPDVCPVDLQQLMLGLKELERSNPEKARKIQPLFISVDPARDTPAVVREFTDSFHPRLIGLTGSPEEVETVVKAYGAYAQKGKENAPGAYLVDHTRTATLFGPAGEPITLINERGTPQEIAAELARWVP